MYFNFILRSILFLLVLIKPYKGHKIWPRRENHNIFYSLCYFPLLFSKVFFYSARAGSGNWKVNFDDLYALPLRFSTLSARPIGLVKYRTFPVVKLLCHYKELHTCNFMGTKAIWRKLFSEVKIVVVGTSLRTVIYLLYWCITNSATNNVCLEGCLRILRFID